MMFINPFMVAPGDAFGPHTYWRILINTVENGSNCFLATLEFRATIGGADQCFGSGGTPSVSSTFNGSGALPFDNNIGTEWASGFVGPPHWVQYQFVSPVSVAQISMAYNHGGVNRAPLGWDVQYSDDGSSWTTAWSVSTTTWGVPETRQFQP